MGQDRRCPASLKFLEKFLKKMKFIVDKSEKVRYTKRVRCERYKTKHIDAWLSLVERCVRDAEVAGSNPVASTPWQGRRCS